MSLRSAGPIRDDVLVLRCIRLGDTSKIVSALSAEYGKVRLVAKGARNLRSRMANLLEPGNQIEAVFYPREGRDLWTMSDASLRRAALTGAGTLDKLSHLFAALELADRLLPDHEGAAEFEPFFRAYVDRWHEAGDEQMSALFFALEMRLLEESGWGLDPRRCGECGQPLGGQTRVHWSMAEGRLDCPRCAGGGGRWIDPQTQRALVAIADLSLDEPPDGGVAGTGAAPASTALSPEERRSVGRLLHEHMGFHLPRYRLPRSLYWLRESEQDRRHGEP